MNLENFKYPIGKFTPPSTISEEQVQRAIETLENFPEKLKLLVSSLSEETLQKPYRPDGWTIKQLIHHIADSHHHSYIRFKWALTEDNPKIKAYNQDAWVAIGDTETMEILWSLKHLEVIHYKLTYLLKSLSEAQWKRTFQHPEKEGLTSLRENILLYAWHSEHHYAHIKNALDILN